MVGSNKILTVSYGTFSCTLEGFDDSFHSMKAIAEYFRDLAQEDRYFGAEPPTPDAEMLARIAEREISRRVEAEMDDRGIRLRATAPQVATVALGAAADAGSAPVEAELEPEPVADEPAAEHAMPPAVDEPVADPDAVSAFMATADASFDTAAPAEAPAAPATPGSFAAKLQRIRSVVNNPLPPSEDVEDFEEAPASSLAADFGSKDDSADTTAEVAEDFAADVLSEDPLSDDVEATTEEEPAVEAVEEDVAEDADTVAEDDSEDMAAAEDELATDDDVATGDDAVEAGSEDEAVEAASEEVTEPEVAEETPEVAEDEVAASEEASDEGTVQEESATDADGDTSEAAEEETVAVEAADEAEADVEEAAEATDTSEETTPEVEEVAEDAAWAKAALAESATEGADILSTDDEDADTAVAADDFDLSETAESADEDLSFDLSDNDLEDVATDDAPETTSRARIVRIRKGGPTEVLTVEDSDEITSNVTARLKTEGANDTDAAGEGALVLDQAYEEEATDADAAAHDGIRAAIAAAMPTGTLSVDDEEDLQRELAEVAQEVVVLEDEIAEPTEVVVEDTSDEDIAEADVPAEAEVEVAAEAEVADDTPAETEAAEVAEEVAEDTAAEPVEAAEEDRPKSKGRKRLPDADHAVTRMIAQTDEALNEPAGSRRRNAIAQLKAAVAATEAARQLGDRAEPATPSEIAFRADLNEVVKPSRPIENPEVSRPVASPLKLVASQRVDGDEMSSDDERPKSRPRTSEATDAGSFAQFAASMGATELPDLLEAAAAYTSFVEGVEDFSRPQIMKKVQMTTTEEFSREDGLRSFGTLLRQGRISKVRNGRFQISEQTRFRPDARSA